ncbi:MFS transporter [Streptomyces sp. TLI_171]|uniref:MFS transporter n=1 Tax=Streptomyces sp. TLI_171 TaxID=1938859 RepID=UPI000C176A17|nr:MFS transporter [Streptomyces sp. TLI_171]RKE20775.1 EmrB/QacA subfamily drug resistance transporter [Streptomyces sp. TLI_171]
MSTRTLPPEGGRTSTGAVLAAVCLAGVLLPVSLTGASVALPSIGTDLGSGLAAVQWVVNGYDLTFASIMLAAGSLADLFGRKRMFGGGLAVFVLCSLLGALAPNILVLDIVRALAGVGAAGVLTAGSAILAQTFDGAARAKAFAMLGTAFGVGIAFGPVLSGLEVSSIGWRGMFLSHALVGGFVLAVLLRHVKESRSPEGGRVDWAGTFTFTGSLFLFILALIQGPQWGWGNPLVIAALVGCVLGLAAFAVVEKRQQRPMFDVTLFTKPRFVAISLVPVVLAFGFTAVLMFLPSYFMSVDGSSASDAGLVLMFLTVPTLVLPMVGGSLTQKLSNRLVLSASLLVTAVGAAWLTVIGPGSSVLALAGPLITIGVGFGIPLGILDGAAISTVEPGRAGMAAGMFNTMRLAGEVVAIAAMGSLLVSVAQNKLADGIDRFTGTYDGTSGSLANDLVQGNLSTTVGNVPAGSRDTFTAFAANGYTTALHTSLWLLAAICAVGAVGIALLLKDRPGAVGNLPVADATEAEAPAQPIAA